MNKKAEMFLNSIITECKRHQEMLTYAYGEIKHLLPFTVENVNKLQKKDISYIDQYIFRFSKLQDAIGQKLFKAVLRYLGEEVNNKSFIDVFNRLEQLGVTEDYELWNELRETRNDISHEYDENKYELAEKMNKIIESKKVLEQYLEEVLSYLETKGLLPKQNGNTGTAGQQ